MAEVAKEVWRVGDRVKVRDNRGYYGSSDPKPTYGYHGWLVAVGPQVSLVCYGMDSYIPVDTDRLARRKPIPIIDKKCFVVQVENEPPKLFHGADEFKLSERVKLLAEIDYKGEGQAQPEP